eukprot:6500782-Pyramimonas_sp.AAC.1
MRLYLTAADLPGVRPVPFDATAFKVTSFFGTRHYRYSMVRAKRCPSMHDIKFAQCIHIVQSTRWR